MPSSCCCRLAWRPRLLALLFTTALMLSTLSSLDCRFLNVRLPGGTPATGPFAAIRWGEVSGEDHGNDESGPVEEFGEGRADRDKGQIIIEERSDGESQGRWNFWENRSLRGLVLSKTGSAQQFRDGNGGVSVGVGLWSFSAPHENTLDSSHGGQCVLYGAARSLPGGVTGRTDDIYYSSSMDNGDVYFTSGRVAAIIAAVCGVIGCSIIWCLVARNSAGYGLRSALPKDILLLLSAIQLLAEGAKFGVFFNIQLCTSNVWTKLVTNGSILHSQDHANSEEYSVQQGYFYEDVESFEEYELTIAKECTMSRGSLACIGGMLMCFLSMVLILGNLFHPNPMDEMTAPQVNNSLIEEGGAQRSVDESASVPSFLLSLGWSSLGSNPNSKANGSGSGSGSGPQSSNKDKSSSSSSASGSWDHYLRWRNRRMSERLPVSDPELGNNSRLNGQVAESVVRSSHQVAGAGPQPLDRRASNETERQSDFNPKRRASNEPFPVQRSTGPNRMHRRASIETERAGNLSATLGPQPQRRHSIDFPVKATEESMPTPRALSTHRRRASAGGRQGPSRFVDSEWSCRACTCVNPPVSLACVACGTTRGERPSRSRYETDVSTVTFERSEKYGIE